MSKIDYNNPLNNSIEILNLTNKSLKLFKRVGIMTIGAVLSADFSPILKRRNGFGGTALEEMKESIQELNLPNIYFGMTRMEIEDYRLPGGLKDTFKSKIIEIDLTKKRREKLLKLPLFKLGINSPIMLVEEYDEFKQEVTPTIEVLENLTIKHVILTKKSPFNSLINKNAIILNEQELTLGLAQLNIPGLMLGMQERDMIRIPITSEAMNNIDSIISKTIPPYENNHNTKVNLNTLSRLVFESRQLAIKKVAIDEEIARQKGILVQVLKKKYSK